MFGTMKIHPPRLAIDAKAPFKDALFGRKELAESLTGLLSNVSESLVIFVDAPWGEGKTTFAEMWQIHLQNEKHDVIYFDAYAYDYFEDPFVSFSAEILSLVDKRLPKNKVVAGPRKEFKKAAAEVGKRLAGLGVKIGLRALTMGAVASGDIVELKDIGADVATGISDIGADIVEKKIEDHTKEKDALKAFKESLRHLAAAVRAEQGFPLTIIVDELDRCRPDFALGLLERIKHLFEVEGVAFVLLVNQEQIESYVRSVYGENMDARGYLLKFANLYVDLPREATNEYDPSSRVAFCQSLFQHFGIQVPSDDNGFLLRNLNSLTEHFCLTLREIEKVFTILSIYYSSLPKGQFSNQFFIVLLAILKVKNPALYRELAATTVDAKRFLAESKLEKLKETSQFQIGRDWAVDMVNVVLLSDQEFSILPTDSGAQGIAKWLNRFDMARNNVIPFLCSKLDRFSVKPNS